MCSVLIYYNHQMQLIYYDYQPYMLQFDWDHAQGAE
jgi:hypothetical protein